MAQEKLLTIREVSILLGVTEKEVIDLAESGKIPAYKVGGVYLRFKKEQIDEFKKNSGKSLRSKIPSPVSSLGEKARDFFYFNDFYILSGLIILLMVIMIVMNYQ